MRQKKTHSLLHFQGFLSVTNLDLLQALDDAGYSVDVMYYVSTNTNKGFFLANVSTRIFLFPLPFGSFLYDCSASVRSSLLLAAARDMNLSPGGHCWARSASKQRVASAATTRLNLQ